MTTQVPVGRAALLQVDVDAELGQLASDVAAERVVADAADDASRRGPRWPSTQPCSPPRRPAGSVTWAGVSLA